MLCRHAKQTHLSSEKAALTPQQEWRRCTVECARKARQGFHLTLLPVVEQRSCHIASGNNDKFLDTCLIDSLRGLGYKIPYCRDGPFWAKADGDRFLAPYGPLSCIRIVD